MEKIINKLIDEFTKGVDTYSHNGSTWLIFTDTKQWVIELTDSKTLWYNYNFFKGMFAYASMDVVENQHYITKWVEDNIINGVKRTMSETIPDSFLIEDTVINGVKSPSPYPNKLNSSEVEHIIQNGIIEKDVTENSLTYVGKQIGCDDAIENGVKETSKVVNHFSISVEDTIENGVKETNSTLRRTLLGVDDIIQNGVKETSHNPTMFQSIYAEDTIQNGVKETIELMNELPNRVKKIIKKGVKKTKMCNSFSPHEAEDVIKNGVKDTQSNPYENESWIEGVIKKGVKKTLWISAEREKLVETTLNNGVKETNHVDVMGFFNNKMEDALQNGVKETKFHISNMRIKAHKAVDKGVKETRLEQNITEGEVEEIIENGVKETNYDTDNYTDDVNEVIREGVKETKTPNKDGDILSTIEWVLENNSTSYPKMIDDVIDNGVKEVQSLPAQDWNEDWGIYYRRKKNMTKPHTEYVNEVIKDGVKEL